MNPTAREGTPVLSEAQPRHGSEILSEGVQQSLDELCRLIDGTDLPEDLREALKAQVRAQLGQR